jgi:succinoglycan biosynthesis transport protein ExoP
MDRREKTKDIDLMDYWKVIVRRKWILIISAGAIVLLTGVLSFLATPQYKSTATLLIEEESSRMLSVTETFSDERRVVQDLRSYNTQLMLFSSKSLAERVARRLNLLVRSEFEPARKERGSLLSELQYVLTFRWLRPQKNQAQNGADPAMLQDPYSDIAEWLQKRIDVRPIRETKLVEVSFTFPSAPLTTEIVNTLVDEFINFSIEKRYSTTQQASDFLTESIANLKNDIGAKERELQRYGQERDISFLSETESTAVSTFADLNEAYNQAMLERINAEAEYRELRNFQGDSVTQYVSDPTIQELKTEYSRVRAEYEEKGRQLKPDHPEMIRVKARLDSLKEEINKAADSAEGRYRAALKKESSIKATLDKQRADVTTMKNNAILYNSLKSEVDSKRRLLNTLLERQGEAQLSAQLKGLSASNISVIDPAEVPKQPVSPKKKQNMLLALLIGLCGGIGLCFLFDYLDDSIKGPDEVEKLAELPSLGVIPLVPPDGLHKNNGYNAYYKRRYSYGQVNPENEHTLPEVKEIELVNHHYPDLPLAEDYRTVRTSILLSHAEKPPKTIVCTSALTQEGKTSPVDNLATSFAQLQERVLLIEADLRKPRLHRIFKQRNLSGLTGYLTGKTPLKDIIDQTFVENVWLIPSGLVPPNPVELLNSRKMRDLLEEVSEVFDIVLLDSPPVLAVIDAVVISSIVEGTMLVIQGGKTRRKPFLAAVDELRRAKANIIGVVVNGLDLSQNGVYYSSHYKYYRPEMTEKEEQGARRDLS